MASQVTTSAKKTVSGRSPYIGKTFQRQAEDIFGRDGYLSGGVTTDNGATITVAPFKMVSRGIIGEALAASSLDVPTSSEPWYIVASLPDDDPDSGVVVQVTRSLQQASTGVVIASKSSNVWRNPHPVDIAGASRRASEPGPESGFSGNYDNTGGVYGGTDGSTLVDKIFANNGRIVTPDGVRIVTNPIAGESGKQFEIAPRPASGTGRRTDRIVLRQREAFSEEIAYLMGGTQGGGFSSALGTGTSGVAPHYYAKRGGTQFDEWWAWGDGADLHIGSIIVGTYTDTTLLTGTAITHVWFAGQRASDDALVLLYIDNGNLQMVSFNATTAAIIDASTNLDALPDAINRVSATLDRDELVHVVFEYDDQAIGSEQQIYYAKFSSATATWAAVAKAPNYALGALTLTGSDIKPSVKVCRNGIAHIVFLRVAGAVEYGDLVYARMDANGNPLDNILHAAATDVAEPIDQNFNDFSDGFAQVAYHSFTHVSLALTPHDEIYVGLGAGRSTQPPVHLLLFSPELVGRLGFPIVQVRQEDTTDGVSIVSDDAGEVILISIYSSAPTIFRNIFYLGTQPGIKGSEDLVIGTGSDVIAGVTPTAPQHVEFGPTGSIVHSIITGTAVSYRLDQGAPSGTDGLPADLHPNDLLLTVVDVDLEGGGLIKEEGIELHQARHKAKNYPIVVGKQGDYLGYGSLQSAVNAISKDGGGEVVLRSGHHWSQENILNVPANVSLIGENGAVIEAFVFLGGSQISAVTISGNVMEDNSILSAGEAVAGAWVLLDTSGWHQIRKVLRSRESDGGVRVLLSDGIDGAAPATAGGIVYLAATGQRFENITVLGNLDVSIARHCTIRNITVKGNSYVFTTERCFQCVFENVDLTQAKTSPSFSASASLGEYNTYRGFRFADGRGYFAIEATEQYPTLIDCKGDDTNPALLVYDVRGVRTTPLATVACEGRFDGNQDLVVTDVGKLVRVPEGLGAMKLEDDGTRGATGPLELTGAAAAFDGATPQVIVDSVNERVRASGDSMSGNLTTNGVTHDIGATGVAVNRFNLYTNILDVLAAANFASTVGVTGAATFLDTIGVTGAATFLNTADITGLATLKNRAVIGTDLLGTVANAEVPRIAMVASTVATVDQTLIMEIPAPGGLTYRKYVSNFGRLTETINASWDNTLNLWSKDLINNESSKRELTEFGMVVKVKKFDVNADWGDGGWTYTSLEVVRGGAVIPETTVMIPLHEGEVGYPNGNTYYQNTSGGGTQWASSASGTKDVEFTVLKVPGRRLVALTVHGTSGAGAGEELEAKLFERTTPFGATQISTTKTSGLANGIDDIGWTAGDAGIKYTLPPARCLTLSVRLPNAGAFGSVQIFGIEYTWDQVQ